MFVFGLFDYALTRDQTLRVTSAAISFTSQNLGVGGFDQRRARLLDRRHGTHAADPGSRARSAAGSSSTPAPRINWSDSANRVRSSRRRPSACSTRSRSGGAAARPAACARRRQPAVRSRLRARHPLGAHRRAARRRRGTARTTRRTISAPTPSRASPRSRPGTPRSYTRRIGDPNIAYKNLQAGVYLQDDIRVRRNLTFSPGVRYEAQTHCQRLQQLRAALRRHLVAGQERQDDAARQRRDLLRLAVDRASTSRRCASTVSASAS